MTEGSARSHWNAYAARWQLIGAPLRPSAVDVEHVKSAIKRFLPPAEPPGRALLLGVTPELAAVEWEPPLELLAVDKSRGMAEGVWPGDTPTRRVQVGDWLSLLAESPFDVALGDGVFTLMDYPRGYIALAGKLAELVRPGGLVCLRLFCRPEAPESVDDVFQALRLGHIGSFHAFKWRLAMALQDEALHSVRLADIWEAFRARVPSFGELAARHGFPEAEVSTIEGYRDISDRYSYATMPEMLAVLETSFELLKTWYPPYELGERCPHLTLRRRA